MTSQNDETTLREVARRVGEPPRRVSLLRWRHGKSEPPEWLRRRPEDLIHRIYARQDRILRDGRVRWAAVVHANATLFQPGPDASGAQVVYAPAGDVPLPGLREVAARTFALKDTTPADPAERRVADMLTDEMERALDWPLPPGLTAGRNVVTTIVMVPRGHVPGGFLGMTHFPVLADPESKLSALVPSRYWPDHLTATWKAATDATVARLDAMPVVRLTPAAVAAVVQMAAPSGSADFWLRVGLKPAPDGGFHYVLDVEYDPPDSARDVLTASCPVQIAVAREHRGLLVGTEIDFRDDPSGRGFVFANPNG